MSAPIANLIAQLMERTGIKGQRELAALISKRVQMRVPPPLFSYWTRGVRNPSVPQAVALADFARQHGIEVDPLVLAGIWLRRPITTPEARLLIALENALDQVDYMWGPRNDEVGCNYCDGAPQPSVHTFEHEDDCWAGQALAVIEALKEVVND